MRNVYIIFILVTLLFSCKSSPEKIVEDYSKKAERTLIMIQKEANSGNVEELMDQFVEYVNKAGKNLSDYTDNRGIKIDNDWIAQMLEKGWKNELFKTAEKFIEELKSVDSDKLKEYGEKMKRLSDKIGVNLLQATSMVAEYLNERAIEFSKTKFAKELLKIWK